MKNAYIVGGAGDYARLFNSMGFFITNDITQADMVVFTGGADVHPYLYGDNQHAYTDTDLERDRREETVFETAREMDIPMVGICRGAQFLNVMSGGRMYQHVDKHCGDHEITDLQTGEHILVSSTHHQMMMPSSEAVLVASSTLGGSREWYDGQIFKKDVSQEDIEVVYYGHTGCLCFQPHPEFTAERYHQMRVYFQSLIHRYITFID